MERKTNQLTFLDNIITTGFKTVSGCDRLQSLWRGFARS